MFKRIDHVEIVTDQLDRTEQFYTEVELWPEVGDGMMG